MNEWFVEDGGCRVVMTAINTFVVSVSISARSEGYLCPLALVNNTASKTPAR